MGKLFQVGLGQVYEWFNLGLVQDLVEDGLGILEVWFEAFLNVGW